MAVQMIDPMTGLPISQISPAPATRSVDAVGGANWPVDSMPVATPVVPDAMTVPAMAMGGLNGGTMANSMAEIGSSQPGGAEPLKKSSFLDKALFTLFGTPDSELTDDAKAKKEGNRQTATELSKSAAENPGKAFMGIPSAGGGSLGESISKIVGALFG